MSTSLHRHSNTWSTCPSGVVLSSLSSDEAEHPFLTLFGLSFRDQNKGFENKKNLFTLYLSICCTGKKTYNYKHQTWADVMFCVGVTGSVYTVCLRCAWGWFCTFIIGYIAHGGRIWSLSGPQVHSVGSWFAHLSCRCKTQTVTHYINPQHNSDACDWQNLNASFITSFCISIRMRRERKGEIKPRQTRFEQKKHGNAVYN